MVCRWCSQNIQVFFQIWISLLGSWDITIRVAHNFAKFNVWCPSRHRTNVTSYWFMSCVDLHKPKPATRCANIRKTTISIVHAMILELTSSEPQLMERENANAPKDPTKDTSSSQATVHCANHGPRLKSGGSWVTTYQRKKTATKTLTTIWDALHFSPIHKYRSYTFYTIYLNGQHIFSFSEVSFGEAYNGVEYGELEPIFLVYFGDLRLRDCIILIAPYNC